jgi:septal ring factor EnvC (AmiA/AmiB activator)
MDPSNVADTMSTSAWLALVIPIFFTTIIGPWLAYKYAVKTADRKAEQERKLAAEQAAETAKHEGRRMDLAEWQAMTADLREEIARLRAARDEDDRKIQSLEQEAETLEAIVRRHRSGCVADIDRLQNQIRALTAWERLVWAALNDDTVYQSLEAAGVKLPPPPIIPDDQAGASAATRGDD